MVNLQVNFKLVPEKEEEFLGVFKNQFAPAMSKQPGFIRLCLLRQRDSQSQYQIEIIFDSEKKRLAWVDTKEHQEIWPKLAALIDSYSATGFDFLEEVSLQGNC